MSGTDRARVYLDWNAAAPLAPAARAAMQAAMDVVGNPSSVHAEGRAARAIVERARVQVATLVGAEPEEVVFTSGASEAVATVAAGAGRVHGVASAHDCVVAWCNGRLVPPEREGGRIGWTTPAPGPGELSITEIANGETGVLQPPRLDGEKAGRLLIDASQWVGRGPFDFRRAVAGWGADFAAFSGQKFGGPRGSGVLLVAEGRECAPLIRGGGQELRRRSGTENVIAIAGLGAAAEAARRALEEGAWERISRLRDILEERLTSAVPELVVIGRGGARLPNTSTFAAPGWKGETQVMQMDLAGFAVSAGSACASGKVGPSRVLQAMGFDDETASSAIRVSIGPTTTESEVMAFADAWIECWRRRGRQAA